MRTLEYWLKVFEKTHVVNRILRYYKRRFGIIAEYGVPPLLQSLALIPAARALEKTGLDKYIDLRLRKHVMLYWPPGWLKSTLLLSFTSIIPDTISYSIESVFSDAVIRGSASGDTFIPPLFNRTDIVIVPEFNIALSSISQDLERSLLSALEKDIISVHLVKLVKALENVTREELEEMRVRIKPPDGIEYKVRATLWTASHTLDTFSPQLRNAILDRFEIVRIPRDKLTKDVALEIFEGINKRDPELEVELKRQLEAILNRFSITKDDFEFIKRKVREVVESEEVDSVNPRLLSEMQRVGIAVSVLFGGSPAPPNIIEAAMVNTLEAYSASRKTLDDEIAEALKERPMTVSEILSKFQISRATWYRIRARIGAVAIGTYDMLPDELKKKVKKARGKYYVVRE